MSRYRRAFNGSTFFFTVVSYNRRPILCDERVRLALRSAIERVRVLRPFSIDGWVLLPDHLHCIWTLPDGDCDYPMRWSEIKRFVSSTAPGEFRDPQALTRSRIRHRESTIWQRRFWEHCVRDEIDFGRHLDYLHINPVRHGFVRQAAEWPYSTFGRYVREGVYPRDWAGSDALSALDFE
jgi:putative transposase